MRTILFRGMCVAALTMALAASAPLALGQPNPSPSLQEQLQAQYPLANATDGCNVGNPETALITQAKGGGLRVLPSASAIVIAKCTNRYTDGKFKFPGSACNGEAISKTGRWLSRVPKIGSSIGQGTSEADGQVSQQQMSVVRTGDTVYPINLQVNETKGEVRFSIITCQQTADGRQNPYKGEIVFQFAKKLLTAANVTQVEDVIGQVFSPPDNNQQQSQAENGQQTPTGSSSPSADIEQGQSINQVEAALGQPQEKFKVGNKEIYVYPKIKITFLDGKVSTIE